MPFGYSKFAQDAQSIRNSLVFIDTLGLSVRYHEHVKISKAMALVWLAACVESFWKSYLSELCARVASAPSRKRRRNMATASLYYFDSMSSLAVSKKLKRWERAIDIFSSLPQLPTSLPTGVPYDGRTVRPEHLALAWRLFSLQGTEFPSPIHRQELITLADRRNDIAHGAVTPQYVGGAVTVGDLRKLISRMEDVADHCVIAATKAW